MLPSCFPLTTECHQWWDLSPQKHTGCVLQSFGTALTKHCFFFFFRLLLFICSPLYLNIISQTATWTHTCFPQHSCAVIRPWLTGLDKTGGFDVTTMYLSRSAQPTSLALISTAYWCSLNKVRAGAPVRTCPVRTETLGLWEDCWDLCF